jgi:exopolyphosphatase/guanosine-5'-triphosphate,3'-diphosphate pyrophosphatase
MNTKLAIIDLGTNTFHLLIAEKQGDSFHIIHRDRQAVKIGKGGINRNLIMPDGIARALNTLHDFKQKINEACIEKIFAFGTSALRNAKNSAEVIKKIKAETGITVTIISGDEEAEFICYGVRAALNLGEEKSLIMDIGGGSVEFIIADNTTIFWKRSLEIGAQRLLEQFQQNNPITQPEIDALENYFATALKPVQEALNIYNPTALVGSSGTFDTLSDIFCLDENILRNDDDRETPLTLEGFQKIHLQLVTKNRLQRMAIPGMIEMRVDMIVVASCMIDYLLKNFPFEQIRVSTYALKEGALAYLGKQFN